MKFCSKMMILLYIILCIAIYFFIIKPQYYWRNKNVASKFSIPIIGEALPLVLGTQNIMDFLIKQYNSMSDVRFFGIFQLMQPILIIKSPDLIKQICVKDYDHFLDHKLMLPDGLDELITNNLVQLKEQKWKCMRSILSPSFTSSKMKAMFSLMSNNANTFTNYFLGKNENIIEVEFKDAFTRYTTDIIANVAFGLQVDSLTDRENDFYVLGKEMSDFSSSWKKFVMLVYYISPKLTKFFGLELFGQKTKDFFLGIVRDTIKVREEKNINRPDMLGLLLEARRELEKEKDAVQNKSDGESVGVDENLVLNTTHLTDTDIASQVFIFFFGGFESVSTAMCLMAHELATNPDVQQKLYEEIEDSIRKHGEPTYDSMTKLQYLEMVVCETLRKWPVTIATDRAVTKPYTIKPEGPNEKPVHLEIGSVAFIPITAIHYDPKYYENPEKFDPDRFLPENREKLHPYTYIPFGVGPRNCIGSRFALLELKAVFFHVLSEFEIVPVAKTSIPIKLKSDVSLTSANGYHLGLKRRKNI